MVVATDRYVAEDAAALIEVTYEFLPPVVGVEHRARRPSRWCTTTCPGNVAARMVQESGDAAAAIAAAPHRRRCRCRIERSASMPMEGKGVLAALGRRRRVAAGAHVDPDVDQRAAGDRGQARAAGRPGRGASRPTSAAASASRSCTRGRRRCWCRGRRSGSAEPVKWAEDRREHFISSAHERGQLHEVEVGYDDDGRLLGLVVRFWHDNGAYTPYGLIVPIITATQLLGPYKPGAYRVEFQSLYTNTVLVTPYRGAGRPQGCFVMERVMDAIARELGLDRAEVRARNFIQPDEMPYDHGLIFQDGRPLIYDSGDFPASLEKLKALVGWDDFAAYRDAGAQPRADGSASGSACYVEGTGVGPVRGRAHPGRDRRHGGRLDRADHPGPGPPDDARADRRRRARRADGPDHGDDRRHPPVQVRRRHVRLAYRGDVGQRGRADRAQGAGEGAADRRRRAGGVRRRPRDRRRRGAGQGQPRRARSTSARSRCCPTRCATPSTRRPQRATQFAAPADPDKPPVADGEEPGLEGTDYYSPPQSTFANGMHAVDRRDRPGDGRDHDPALLRRARLRHDHQPDDRRGPGPRRGRAGRRRRALRADGVRRVRAAAQRVVHGLPDAVRQRGPAHRDRPPRDAVAAQPARRQGRGGGRRDPRLGRDRRRRSRTPRAFVDHTRCRSRRASCSRCARLATATPEAG